MQARYVAFALMLIGSGSACGDETSSGVVDALEPDATFGGGGNGETCATAIDVSAGGTLNGSTLDAPEHLTCTVGGVGVGARVHTIHTSTAKRFVVRATPAVTTPDFTNLSLSVKRDCAQPLVCVVESLIHVEGDTPGTVKAVFDLQAGDTVFVFVTGWLASDVNNARGDYTLTVEVDPGPDGDDCGSAIDVTNGGSWGSSTTSAVDDYQGGAGCGTPQAGPDRVYKVMSSQAHTYNLRLDAFSGGTNNLSMFVMNNCDTEACTALTSGNLGADLAAAAGTTYSIVVKGQMTAGTDYMLHVRP
jgi:hypothetical protein